MICRVNIYTDHSCERSLKGVFTSVDEVSFLYLALPPYYKLLEGVYESFPSSQFSFEVLL
jgi:hypothetical protein